jgi:methanogen homoisocitrate dehydrogenase
VHGSAPDIAGKGIANPVAAILCVKMMMEWLGDIKSASLVEDAVNHVLKRGIITPELGGTSSTKDVGHAVAEYINMRV